MYISNYKFLECLSWAKYKVLSKLFFYLKKKKPDVDEWENKMTRSDPPALLIVKQRVKAVSFFLLAPLQTIISVSLCEVYNVVFGVLSLQNENSMYQFFLTLLSHIQFSVTTHILQFIKLNCLDFYAVFNRANIISLGHL